MSRLGVGIGFGPQKEDSMSIVCGEPDLSPEEEEEMEETLVSPGDNHGDDDIYIMMSVCLCVCL